MMLLTNRCRRGASRHLVPDFLAVAATLLFLLPLPAYGQSAMDAYNALKKLDVQTFEGISYSEYVQALEEAKAVVIAYMDSDDPNKTRETASRIQSALYQYQSAEHVWALGREGKLANYQEKVRKLWKKATDDLRKYADLVKEGKGKKN